jgi:hypothetical protein
VISPTPSTSVRPSKPLYNLRILRSNKNYKLQTSFHPLPTQTPPHFWQLWPKYYSHRVILQRPHQALCTSCVKASIATICKDKQHSFTTLCQYKAADNQLQTATDGYKYATVYELKHSADDWLIGIGVRALRVPMHINRPLVPHNLIPAQESPVPC